MRTIQLAHAAAALSLALVLAGCDKNETPSATVAPAASNAAPAAPAPAAESATYTIEPSTSKVEWTGAKVTAHHEGGFKQFSGTIVVPSGKPELAKIHLDIDTTSLFADPDKLAGHLKSPDFFDVQKFPKATFDSTSIAPGGAGGASYTVTGNLNLHGVTKSVSFPVAVAVTPDKLTAKADFSIVRKDFGIVYPGMPDDLIKDEVNIHLTIAAPKKS